MNFPKGKFIGYPIPMPAGIGFSLRRGREGSLTCIWCVNTQGTSVILSPDPQGLCGQPKHEACHRTQDSNPQLTGVEASVLTPKPN